MLHDPKWDEQLKQLEAESLLELDKPSLKALSYILRHKELWPKGFSWYFPDCERCAMGLARDLWDHKHGKLGDLETALPWTKNIFNIKDDYILDIFSGRGIGGLCRYSRVTPEMVADAIEEHLASSNK